LYFAFAASSGWLTGSASATTRAPGELDEEIADVIAAPAAAHDPDLNGRIGLIPEHRLGLEQQHAGRSRFQETAPIFHTFSLRAL
jgi:hypothetical protein